MSTSIYLIELAENVFFVVIFDYVELRQSIVSASAVSCGGFGTMCPINSLLR